MKFIPSKSKGTPLGDEPGFSGTSSDLIRAGSVKSNGSARNGMAPTDGPANPSAANLSGMRKHRCAPCLGLYRVDMLWDECVYVYHGIYDAVIATS